MKLNSARQAWHDCYYQPWDSVMAGAMDRAKLGMDEAGGYVRKVVTETTEDGKEITYPKYVFVPGIHQTRPERDISTSRAVHQALSAHIQRAIDTLPGHIAAFGHWMYSPMGSADHKEIAEAAVALFAYDRHGRMTAKKAERAKYVAAGVLHRYRRMHQGGQSSMADPLISPEAFRAWLDGEYGLRLSSEQWGREWGGYVQHCFDVCNDLDRQALAPVAGVIVEMKEAA